MKKILSLVLVAIMIASVCCFTSCGEKDDNTIVVYTEAGFAPYEFMYNNEIVGVDIAIMKAVGEELGKEVVFNDVDFNTICSQRSAPHLRISSSIFYSEIAKALVSGAVPTSSP